ncbi:MAG: K(+)-transporting ATPase subunit C [Actinomycetota bacterium]|nr:K(+)-transporting ATPase subunit C [Actinomycetota bacterium]
MLRQLRRGVVLALLFLVVCGLAYPLAETALAQGLFGYQANGSIGAGGSVLIGQTFTGPGFFHTRPDSNQPMATGGSNLGPRSAALVAQVKSQIAYWHSQGVSPTNDLVTTSGSGVDPDISPAAAYAQVPMVAKARGLSVRSLENLVASQVHGRQLGFLGSPYVNVLELNRALARLSAPGLASGAA